MRTMAVPTDDKKVRERLRAFGEPITLFAEGVRDMQMDGRMLAVNIVILTRFVSSPATDATASSSSKNATRSKRGGRLRASMIPTAVIPRTRASSTLRARMRSSLRAAILRATRCRAPGGG
jgi:hypothetical protein